jgi:hypothetical protein
MLRLTVNLSLEKNKGRKNNGRGLASSIHVKVDARWSHQTKSHMMKWSIFKSALYQRCLMSVPSDHDSTDNKKRRHMFRSYKPDR